MLLTYILLTFKFIPVQVFCVFVLVYQTSVFVLVYYTCVVYLCGEPVVRSILALSRLTLGTCQHQTPLVLTIIIFSIIINFTTIIIFRDG